MTSRKRPRVLSCGALATAAIFAAGCGTSSPAAPARPAQPSATTAPVTAVHLTCKQQSDTWKASHKSLFARFQRALKPYSADSVTSSDADALTRVSKDLAAVPPPSCADPKGYWATIFANLETAGQASSGGGMLSELGAMTPLENALTSINEMSAELERTIGSSKL
jgi:hypothetical protein